MKRSQIGLPPSYYDRYITQVDDIEINAAMDESLVELRGIDRARWSAVGWQVYEAGKWTLNATVRHMIDAEHVMSYRALRLGRFDDTPLPGFDQDVLAKNVAAESQSLDELLDEWIFVREATARLFHSFTDDALRQVVPVNDTPMSALAFGFTIVGHQKHHLRIIAEKYLPLIEPRHQAAEV